MVFEKIREIIAEQTGKDESEITLETNVKEDLDADSLDLLLYSHRCFHTHKKVAYQLNTLTIPFWHTSYIFLQLS